MLSTNPRPWPVPLVSVSEAQMGLQVQLAAHIATVTLTDLTLVYSPNTSV